jgi:hypothetical protein
VEDHVAILPLIAVQGVEQLPEGPYVVRPKVPEHIQKVNSSHQHSRVQQRVPRRLLHRHEQDSDPGDVSCVRLFHELELDLLERPRLDRVVERSDAFASLIANFEFLGYRKKSSGVKGSDGIFTWHQF